MDRNTLSRRLKGHQGRQGHAPTHSLLTDAEEAAICHYIDRLDRINLAVRSEIVEDAANLILQERSATAETGEIRKVGKHWTRRFLQRRGYFHQTQKQLESNRQYAENIEAVRVYFQLLGQTIQALGLHPADIWNMDETGFRIGVGKDQLVVTKRKRAHYFALPENRESATAIESISAAGVVIPAFLLLTGQVHVAHWYGRKLHPDTALRPCETGYSNDEISLEWLQHFDRHSRKSQVSSKRLLIVDGHGSHHTRQFIQYCDDHGIVPFGMPPHLTHLLQPLDVVCFQPYKHWHAKALDQLVRDGCTNITKLEFLDLIEDVRSKAFKPLTIQSAFEKTGIWPFNPIPVLTEIEKRQPTTPTPPPSGSSNEVTPNTVRQFNKSANKIRRSLNNMDDEGLLRLDRFIKASLTAANEVLQLKRDLGRTQYAERVQKARRQQKNYQLQSGGVLTVAEGREMVKKKIESDEARARRILQQVEEKRYKIAKKAFQDAAKEARRMRIKGLLKPCEVVQNNNKKGFLRRF